MARMTSPPASLGRVVGARSARLAPCSLSSSARSDARPEGRQSSTALARRSSASRLRRSLASLVALVQLGAPDPRAVRAERALVDDAARAQRAAQRVRPAGPRRPRLRGCRRRPAPRAALPPGDVPISRMRSAPDRRTGPVRTSRPAPAPTIRRCAPGFRSTTTEGRDVAFDQRRQAAPSAPGRRRARRRPSGGDGSCAIACASAAPLTPAGAFGTATTQRHEGGNGNRASSGAGSPCPTLRPPSTTRYRRQNVRSRWPSAAPPDHAGQFLRIRFDAVQLGDRPRHRQRELRSPNRARHGWAERAMDAKRARASGGSAGSPARRTPTPGSRHRPPPPAPRASTADTSSVGAGAAAPMPPNQRPSAPRRSRTPKCSRAGASTNTASSIRRFMRARAPSDRARGAAATKAVSSAIASCSSGPRSCPRSPAADRTHWR